MANVYVMRGVPGSGKSTVAKMLAAEGEVNRQTVRILSTDDFFMVDGKYQFDAKRLSEAHGLTLRLFVAAVTNLGSGRIIVDNTNASVAEIAPYMALAQAYAYRPCIVEIDCPDLELAAERTTHGVPLEVIRKMAETLRTQTALIPPWWERTILPMGLKSLAERAA